MTKQLLQDGRCVNVGCKGRVVAQQFSERQTNDTLRYLQGLFDVKKFKDENAKEMGNSEEHPHSVILSSIKAVVDDVIGHSKYNKVDLNSLFSFMDK